MPPAKRPTVRAVADKPPTAPAPRSPSGPVVARARGLHKWYGRVHALDGVDLEVHKGEVMGFLGPNGAGKTTFTRCLLGFLKPSAGQLELLGYDMTHAPRAALDRTGVVPDQYDFYGNLNALQHLEFYGRLHGLRGANLRRRMDEVVALTGMQEFARRRVSGYSHGMKQRLCIAQALINKPEFIVFDEPTNGLDPRGAYETRQLIKNLSREGTTIFLNSHILPEVEDVCTRVAILSRGKILVQAPVTDLRRQLKGDRTRVTVSVDNPSQALERAVITRDAALSAHLQGPGLVCELGPQHSIPELVSVLTKAGARIRGVQEEVLGLEDIFLQLTQGEGGV